MWESRSPPDLEIEGPRSFTPPGLSWFAFGQRGEIAVTRMPHINAAALLVRDVEDLARFSKEYEGKNGEGLFARATIIMAVIALEHFVDLHLERVGDGKKK